MAAEYFLIRSGSHYIVAQMLMKVKLDALTPAVKTTTDANFTQADQLGVLMEAISIPSAASAGGATPDFEAGTMGP